MLRQPIHYRYLIKQGHSVSTVDMWTFIVSGSHRGETVTFSQWVKTVSESAKRNSRNSTHRSNAGESIFGSQSAMTAKTRGNLVPHFTANRNISELKAITHRMAVWLETIPIDVVKERLEFATTAQHKSLTGHQQFNDRLTELDASSNCAPEETQRELCKVYVFYSRLMHLILG